MGECKAGTFKCLGGQLACQGATIPRPDTCDNLDNNCDGSTDEAFDKMNDPRFCGGCNANCTFTNAIALCTGGACSMGPCKAGWVDLDGSPATGCELACSPTGPEVCDGKDNDCDNKTDAADNDLLYPPTNFCRQAGECGKGGGTSTKYPGAGTFPVCTTPGGTATPDWICNYPATVQLQAANEIVPQESWCDSLDNDCDNATDEHQPSIGNDCFDTGVGECKRKGKIACVAANRTAAPTCNYGNNPAPVAANESCDNKDNDCDGITDESWDNPAGLTQCSGANCLGVRDSVALVTQGNPAYYIYQYEASRPDAGSGAQGASSARACSTTARKPWTSIDYDAAQTACAAAGMRLCRTNRLDCNSVPALTRDEWGFACAFTRACVGTQPTMPYGCSYGATTCNGVGNGIDTTVAAGSKAGCATADLNTTTAGVVDSGFDMSGNVSEWTEDCRGKLSNVPIYTVRGGDYLADYFAGVPSALECDFYQFQVTKTYKHPSTGFRCCSSCAPGLAECSNACVNLATSAANCGKCGTVCGGGTTCVNGICK